MQVIREPILFVNTEGQVKPLQLERYPDGTPLVRETDTPTRILFRTSDIGALMAVLWWVDAVRQRHVHPLPIQLIIPAVPGARQDRLMVGGGDQLFTIASVAREINARTFISVVVIDPHSDVTPALLNACKVVTAAQCLALMPTGESAIRYDGIIAPDGGAAKRAQQVATMWKRDMYQGSKLRSTVDGSLKGFDITNLEGVSHALMVDDLCDGGGTFVGLAQRIRDDWPDLKLDLYTTHGYYTRGLQGLQNYFDRFLTTDTVIRDYPYETVPTINVCEALLQGKL